MSRRRFLLAVAAATTLTLSACSQAVPTKISVSQAQLEQGLLQQIPRALPRRRPAAAGSCSAPPLQLLPASNQLQTHLPVQLSGPALRQSYAGRMEVRFALRYEPRTAPCARTAWRC